MNYSDIQVGMYVYLENGYENNFKGCVGRIIAIGRSHALVDFSLNGNKPPFEGSRDYIPPHYRYDYTILPEALERPKYASRWWVHPNYFTAYNNNMVLDGGLL